MPYRDQENQGVERLGCEAAGSLCLSEKADRPTRQHIPERQRVAGQPRLFYPDKRT
ncbi:MAG: hypothetical protein ACM3PY_05315 [Omnitrophica WOR_2 bacterium]